jgi:predicted transcriptional regulator
MIQIMKLMWEHDPQKRPSIFEVVDFLSEVQRNSIKFMPSTGER